MTKLSTIIENIKKKRFTFPVPAISPRNRHRPAPKDTLRYIHSIIGPVPVLSKTDRPGLKNFSSKIIFFRSFTN